MTIKDWLHSATTQLVDASSSPRLDALLLLEHTLKMDRAHILAHDDDPLDEVATEALNDLLAQRLHHAPIAYLTGSKDFYGLLFEVTHDVLIPRPETEIIVEYVTAHSSDKKNLLDVGTGSGAIAISIKKTRPALIVTAADISEAALAVTRMNAQKHSTDITVVQSDLLESIHEKFDVIVANLPYVPDEMKTKKDIAHEPILALFSGEDGLDLYRVFIPQVEGHLSKDGYALVEHLPSQTSAIATLASEHGLENKPISDYITRLSLE